MVIAMQKASEQKTGINNVIFVWIVAFAVWGLGVLFLYLKLKLVFTLSKEA